MTFTARAVCSSSLAMTHLFDNPEQQHAARNVCHTCPVLAECRAWTLAEDAAGRPPHGVSGGMLPEERVVITMNRTRRETSRVEPVQRGRRTEIVTYRPCGTYAAAHQHERRGEPLDDACRIARRQYWTDRARSRKQRAQPVDSRVERSGYRGQQEATG